MDSRRQQGGFTLLEVLVAAIVLAIGLIGVAGLQYAGIKSSQDSYGRSQAAFLIYAITDSIRANAETARAGGYDIDAGGSVAGSPTVCVGETADCTPTELALWDLFKWKKSMGHLLPGGDGSILSELDAATGVATIQVSVNWTSMQGSGGTDTIALEMEI